MRNEGPVWPLDLPSTRKRLLQMALKDEVLAWLTCHNSKRLNSTLDYISLMDFEKKRLAEQSKLVA